MRVLLQRVQRAQVTVDERVTGSIGPGLLLLVGFAPTDDDDVLAWMSRKCLDLRVFNDEKGKMNRSLLESDGAALVVSQFTLYGDARKGRRPSFVGSARPEIAIPLYERFGAMLAEAGVEVAWGEFGAHMDVELVNDGPVTLMLEREASA